MSLGLGELAQGGGRLSKRSTALSHVREPCMRQTDSATPASGSTAARRIMLRGRPALPVAARGPRIPEKCAIPVGDANPTRDIPTADPGRVRRLTKGQGVMVNTVNHRAYTVAEIRENVVIVEPLEV